MLPAPAIIEVRMGVGEYSKELPGIFTSEGGEPYEEYRESSSREAFSENEKM